jgi:predicted dehydrogenase
VPLRLAVLGAGDHSQRNHLPALADFARRHPGQVELVALCDLRYEHAVVLASRYGFKRVYADLETMLSAERLEGCIAVTPLAETFRLAKRILHAKIPLLMEKPPGETLDQAQEISALAASLGVPVMVSMNRRFDPALKAGLDWLGERSVAYLHAIQARHNRREPDFITGTAIHVIDTACFLGGEVHSWQSHVRLVDGVKWAQVALSFASGALGWVEILPTAGCVVEQYELCGPDYRLLVRAGGVDAGEALAWEKGKLVFQTQAFSQAAEYIANGVYAETKAFIGALLGERPFYPTPEQVYPSVELCHSIFDSLPSPDLGEGRVRDG